MTDDQILKDYKAAMDKQDAIRILAQINKTTVHAIREKLEGMGQKLRPIHEKYDKSKLMWFYQQGLNDREIEDKTGIPYGVIGRWRAKNNLPSNCKKPIPPDFVLELYNKGWNDYQIAEYLGCTQAGVRCCRFRLGLPATGNRRKRRWRRKPELSFRRILNNETPEGTDAV